MYLQRSLSGQWIPGAPAVVPNKGVSRPKERCAKSAHSLSALYLVTQRHIWGHATFPLCGLENTPNLSKFPSQVLQSLAVA